MNTSFEDIDAAIRRYVEDEIAHEITQELEDLIFFSSYTVNFDVFQKATHKLKKMARRQAGYGEHVWRADVHKLITRYGLDVAIPSERYAYMLKLLLQAQIQINESVIRHFKDLCQRAHSLEYLQTRTEAIYRLLFDEKVCSNLQHVF
ncbi:hypothetical protein [Sulfurospirillum cavolei]|uniref:hypothetical protein n=1 Tax=Sulfurospirillum cavolei TaxID=366522 RepID=UPI0007648F74|nr:hypothetical protein [Sulfurospirillum cavolei]